MWYTITILSLICSYQPVFAHGTSAYSLEALSEARGTPFILPPVAEHCVRLTQARQADAPPRQEPAPQKKDSASGDTRKPEAPPGQKDKKPPPGDFVPSEKIDADKAVDFPVDI
jgi:hypothetical protein